MNDAEENPLGMQGTREVSFGIKGDYRVHEVILIKC